MGVHAPLLPAHRRKAIECEIEACLARVSILIGRLDRADAPFEDIEEDDWPGTDLDHGEGEGHFGQGLYTTLPRYGVDQTTGPTNVRAAERLRHKAMMAG